MMVTFVSECEKKALKRTRRVLDAFANRIGSRTWQTIITEEGLLAVKKLLKRSASKNTAVSCHWIRSRSRSDLLWVVGKRSKFSLEGYVPVNYTDQETAHYSDGAKWKTLDVIKYAAAIAALFHDFGKANVLFQNKLNPKIKTKERFEPYRHEWVSLRLFQALVGEKNDADWLESLRFITADNFDCIFKDGFKSGDSPNFLKLPPFARLIAWLILTHHYLPLYPKWKDDYSNPPDLDVIDNWLDEKFKPFWNSHVCESEDQRSRLEDNWELNILPTQSSHWIDKIREVAISAKTELVAWEKKDWFQDDPFTMHFSRLALMLADHYYSSLPSGTEKWSEPNYNVYANTKWEDDTKKKRVYKQQLDDHLIGVSHHAQKIVLKLPKFIERLRGLTSSKKVLDKSTGQYSWQNSAQKVAKKVGKKTKENGFFGINMASTGTGKTRANAKIMTALGSETGRVRFSVALGLRVLTLQTGKEFREELGLTDEELAIAVGGIATKVLFERKSGKEGNNTSEKVDNPIEEFGMESTENLELGFKVNYRGKRKHKLKKWTAREKNLDNLILAPVLVSTIDHLIPATEGTRGGRQIAPLLRLLSADLVLDEPDDFGLNDLPALARLVNFAGMCGSRVLLSTATMPPALANALFRSYREGWAKYALANINGWNVPHRPATLSKLKQGFVKTLRF